jgi:hypothetical protein
MPPEILLGIGDVNHWGAWGIDEHAWKAHLQPVAQQLVDDLTSAYFQPALRELGVENWQEHVIGYDATKVINHPDRSKDAKDLYDRRAIGKEALRDAGGFDEDDAPTEEELNEMLGVEIRDASLAVYGIPQIRGTGGIEPAAGEIESRNPAGGTVDAGDAPAEVKKAPPPNPDDKQTPPGESGSTVIGSLLAARVLGASEIALARTRELAGNRLRCFVRDQKQKDLYASLSTVRSRDVPNVIGRDRAIALGCPSERELVSGAELLLGDALVIWGIPEATSKRLASLLSEHAARHLWDKNPPPLPLAYENYCAALGSPTGVRSE